MILLPPVSGELCLIALELHITSAFFCCWTRGNFIVLLSFTHLGLMWFYNQYPLLLALTSPLVQLRKTGGWHFFNWLSVLLLVLTVLFHCVFPVHRWDVLHSGCYTGRNIPVICMRTNFPVLIRQSSLQEKYNAVTKIKNNIKWNLHRVNVVFLKFQQILLNLF